MIKKIYLTAIVVASALLGYAQVETSLTSFSSNEKIAIARSSIDVPSWHEKSFWPLYEQYVTEAQEIANRNVRLRQTIAAFDNSISAEEAASIAESILEADNLALTTKKEYYQKVSDELNGILSLQFLQGEVLMDMMESAKVYEQSPIRKYRFHPKLTSDQQYNKAKHNTLHAALSLTKDNDYFFWNIYYEYEKQVDNILGKDYTLISFYAGEPNDFTPALAKRLGHDLLAVMDRELRLKQKYYAKLKAEMGPVIAAKFLAWEDYYSLVSKMHAWAEAQ
jgi:hypothetical protein